MLLGARTQIAEDNGEAGLAHLEEAQLFVMNEKDTLITVFIYAGKILPDYQLAPTDTSL